MDRPAVTDANTKMSRKSDDSSKFEHSFRKVEVFLLTYDHNASTDIGGWSRKIRLEQKSMQPNFDVEVKNDEKMENFKMILNHAKMIKYDKGRLEKALRVSRAVTRLTVYRPLEVLGHNGASWTAGRKRT